MSIGANIHPYLPFEYIERCSVGSREETPKHDFKVGDKVRVNYPYEMKEKRAFQGEILTIAQVMDSYVIAVSQGIRDVCLAFDEIEPYDGKHEFKPFDKVLVRNTSSEWQPKLYSQKCILGDGTYDDGYMSIDEKRYRYCIPYEGNEHLVGTTNNPE